MNKLMIALCLGAGVSLAASALAQTNASATLVAPLSKEGYASAKKDAAAQYKIDRAGCDSASGNAKDICVAQAKGKESIAKAEATAAFENTPKSREAARVAHAQATYAVAIEHCDDLAGNGKDVCVKEAKAELVKGKANAKVDRVAAVTRQEGAAKRDEARTEANNDKNNALYKVAIEKCDALAGAMKDTCVGNAKTQYGKT